MPTSTDIFKKQTIDYIVQRFSPETEILDIGAGNGTYSRLLKTIYPNLDALEVFEPYVEEYNLRDKYRSVIVGDVMHAEIDVSKYSLFILGDVFEHINEQDATKLLKKLTRFGAEVIIAVPFNAPQGDVFGNPFERHLQPKLTFAKMIKLYDGLIPLCIRYDYGVFVTNKKENNYYPIFYKEVDDDFIISLKSCYPYKSIINVDEKLEEKNPILVFSEQENNTQVTIVTGLWDLGRSELSGGFERSYKHYKEQFAQLLKTPCNMFIYVSKEDEEFIWNHRDRSNTYVKTIELSEFDTWFEFFNKTQEIRKTPEWFNQVGWLTESPQAKLKYYNPLVMSKMFMLNNATLFNPFQSGQFYWIDAAITNTVHPGYFSHDRVFDNLGEICNQINGALFISYPYDGGEEIHGFSRNEMAKYCNTDYVRYVCRGGFFGGTKEQINQLNSIYHGILSDSLSKNLMGTEESIFTIMAHKYPELITRFSVGSDGLIWPFFEKLKTPSEFIKELPAIVTCATAKNVLYVLGFNSPSQFESIVKSIETTDVDMFVNSRRILINNSTDEELFSEYDRLCELYAFEEIHRENLGVCGGRQFAAEHFQELDADFYMFFEDDMHLTPFDATQITCRNGFVRHVSNLYKTVVKIMLKEKFDFLKFSFSELYGDNGTQWAWYNVPQKIRTDFWPNYDKLPETGLDSNAPKTQFDKIDIMDQIPYIKGEIYYSNWPQIVSREGNKKMFLDTKWERPYEQTWMSHMFQLTKNNQLQGAVLLASPITHDRFDHYDGSLRKES